MILEEQSKKDLKLARKVITNSGPTMFVTGKYDLDKPYWANTQNLSYITDLTKKQEIHRAFTILGSSDNVFELVKLGVPEIVATDINPFAKYIFYLKKAALKTLDVKEYISFLLDPTSTDFFKKDIFFNKVIYGFEDNEEAYRVFWQEMFKNYDKKDILDKFAKPIFRSTKGVDRVKSLTYIQNKKYGQLQENLDKSKIEIYEKDALVVLKDLDSMSFDWIDITNILLWVLQFNCQDDTKKFKTYIIELEEVIRRVLADNGIFAIDYMFKTFNPKWLLRNDNLKNNVIMDRISEVYGIIFRTINEYFDISTMRYNSIPSTFPNQDNKTPDQLVLARLKK